MSKERYIETTSKDDTLPIFFRPWWLNAVAGDNWDVVLSTKGDEIHGFWVFMHSKKFGFKVLKNPTLTPYLGVWLNYPEGQKTTKKLSFEKKTIKDLADQLPSYSVLSQRMHYTMTNWLPLYWEGFDQSTRYTYLIEKISNNDAVWDGLQSRIRRAIKKSRKRFGIEVYTSDDLEEFYRLYQMTFTRQKKQVPHSFDLLKRIDEVCKENDARTMLFAKDEKGNHAALYIVYDNRSAYYLMGGSDPDKRNSGAISLLMWEAIKRSSERVDLFDFEGSMIPDIENFFSSFGGKQQPFFEIKHYKNLALRIGDHITS